MGAKMDRILEKVTHVSDLEAPWTLGIYIVYIIQIWTGYGGNSTKYMPEALGRAK